MVYKYSMQAEKENTARAAGISLSISRKQGIEICNYIRRKRVARAKQLLDEAIAKKRHVPFKRFTEGAGHKRGVEKGPGKYPIKACKAILGIVKLAESNAQFKGLNTGSLVLKHISCQQAPQNFRQSRHRGRKAKSAHIEVIVEETEKAKPVKKAAKKEEKDVKKEKADEKESGKESKKELVEGVKEMKEEEKKRESKENAKESSEEKPAAPAVKDVKVEAKHEAEQKNAESKTKADMSKEQKNELK